MTPIPCAGLLAALKSAAAGAVIAVAGTCAPLTINGVHAPGVTVDMSAAPFSTLAIYHSSGITVSGGVSTDAPGNAVVLILDSDMVVRGVRCVRPGNSCVTVSRSDHVDVDSNAVEGSKGDGFDVSGSTFVHVHGNVCSDNQPTPTHPDCVQGWSIPATATSPMVPLTDFEVDHNFAVGPTQGFDVFDHFFPSNQRVNIHDNGAVITDPRCVSLLNGTDGRVANNLCRPYPGAKWAPNVDVQGGVNVVAAANVVTPLP